ncbi:MAG: tetratricopeptide repeat protein [Candidatus Peribacteraceae bacterium]|nr:tetratricopeptide repeat protein [Candidatus Peribacteraceae bacterium]
MKIPPRVTVPVAFALLCAGALVAFVWWNLNEATEQLIARKKSTPLVETSTGTTVIEEIPIDPRDQALLHLRQGDIFALRGEWEEAEAEYQRAVDANGGLPALRKLAQAQLQRRDLTGLQETLHNLKAAGARAEDVFLIETIILLRTGELVTAREKLESAEDSPQKHYGLALLGIIEGNHEAAQNELKNVMGGWEPTLRSYARSLQSAYDEFALFPEGKNMHLVTLLSRALAQVQECELALPLLAQVTQQQDDYRDAWIVRGYCELTTERFGEALTSLERAYNLNPEKPETQYFLARAYAALGQHDNAITFLEYALENGFEPQAEVRRILAAEALTKGDNGLALRQYEALTQEKDVTMESFEGYVTTALALGRKEEASAMAQRALERFPENAVAYDLSGWTLAALDRKEEARAALTRALEIDPLLASAKERLEKLK